MKKIVMLALVLILTACSASSGYDQNLKKWQDADVTHYRYTLFIGCFCAFMDQMPLTIEVKDGGVVSVTRTDGRPAVPADMDYQFFEPYLTIDRLFLELGAELSGDADEVAVTYDPVYGFPVSIAIDQIKVAMDDELSLQISDFEILE